MEEYTVYQKQKLDDNIQTKKKGKKNKNYQNYQNVQQNLQTDNFKDQRDVQQNLQNIQVDKTIYDENLDYTKYEIQLLQNMFPNVQQEKLNDIYFSNELNMYKSIEILMNNQQIDDFDQYQIENDNYIQQNDLQNNDELYIDNDFDEESLIYNLQLYIEEINKGQNLQFESDFDNQDFPKIGQDIEKLDIQQIDLESLSEMPAELVEQFFQQSGKYNPKEYAPKTQDIQLKEVLQEYPTLNPKLLSIICSFLEDSSKYVKQFLNIHYKNQKFQKIQIKQKKAVKVNNIENQDNNKSENYLGDLDLLQYLKNQQMQLPIEKYDFGQLRSIIFINLKKIQIGKQFYSVFLNLKEQQTLKYLRKIQIQRFRKRK